ncbi:hypothetical protein ACIFOE_25120 [Paenibacillus sp. NRS-1783]|uniref:hypothetical protein n=1 Tax=Paenibacillus sp. NRS-1783 TaxID=3233907 RepID=UPI003D2947CA
MIHFFEFRVPVSLSDDLIAKFRRSVSSNGVTVQLLPQYHKKQQQLVKVLVNVPSFLYCGDYEENAVIHDRYMFIQKIRDHLITIGIPAHQLLPELPYRADKLTVGFNAFFGSRKFYREVVPPTECIRYSASSKWVYHIGPKSDFLTAFNGQGKKLMLPSEAGAKGDYMKHISIHEGIFSFRFDLTRNQMNQISSNRCLTELLDENKLSKILGLWSNRLHPLPIFDSVDQIMKLIDETNAYIHVKHRVNRFLKLLLECGSKECEQYYSRASIIRHYSDLKKLLHVPAILLREHNDESSLFIQPYVEWLTESRQGRGVAELVPALTSGL